MTIEPVAGIGDGACFIYIGSLQAGSTSHVRQERAPLPDLRPARLGQVDRRHQSRRHNARPGRPRAPLNKGERDPMRSKLALALLSIAAMALDACTSAASPSAPRPDPDRRRDAHRHCGPREPASSPAASLSSEPTASPGGAAGGGQATPGSIDPCTLLTADQASKAIGKTLSAGVSTTLDPNRVCTFKNGKSEVKVILAPPAPDSKTATAYWDAARATVPAGRLDQGSAQLRPIGVRLRIRRWAVVERAVRDRRDEGLRVLLRLPGVQPGGKPRGCLHRCREPAMRPRRTRAVRSPAGCSG